MKAMRLEAPLQPLRACELPVPEPGAGQILIRVRACGVCRTDLHVVDGELTDGRLPLPLDQANKALARLREGRITGAAVLVPGPGAGVTPLRA